MHAEQQEMGTGGMFYKGLFAMSSGLIGLGASYMADVEAALRIIALVMSILGAAIAIRSALKKKV